MAYTFEIPFRNGRNAVFVGGETFEEFSGGLFRGGATSYYASNASANHVQGFKAVVSENFLLHVMVTSTVLFTLSGSDLNQLGLQANEVFHFEVSVEHSGSTLGPNLSTTRVRIGVRINGNYYLQPTTINAGTDSFPIYYTLTCLMKDRYFGNITDPHLLKWSVKQAEFSSKAGSPVSAYDLANGFSVTESGNARAGVGAQMLEPNDSLIAARVLGKARLNHRSPRGAKGSVRPVFADRTFGAVNTPIRFIGDTTNTSFDVTYNAGENVIDASNLADVNLGLDLVIDNF